MIVNIAVWVNNYYLDFRPDHKYDKGFIFGTLIKHVRAGNALVSVKLCLFRSGHVTYWLDYTHSADFHQIWHYQQIT